MNSKLVFTLAAAGTLAAFAPLHAAESGSGGNWLQVGNRLRLEYDDNVYERETDKEDSIKIIEEIDFGMTFNLEPTFITLRYRPAFTYWDNREPDDTDLHHDFDVVVNHQFSPRTSAGVRNTFRVAESPEVIDRGTKVRENGDYTYNVTDANIDHRVLPRTHVLVGGRYTLLRYDLDEVAVTEDYDIWSLGVTLRQSITELSRALLDYRHESIDYDLEIRSSESDYVGLGFEHVLGASLVTVVRGGYQMKTFEDESIEDAEEPYFDATLTYLVSPRTRLSAGAGYSMFEADIFPFANQTRIIYFGSIAHDLTARLSLFASASVQDGDYDLDQRLAVDFEIPETFEGSEEVTQFSARAAYKLNARNSLELNYQYINLDSELRNDFDRNRVSLGWRLEI
jgi:hypothetical protein